MANMASACALVVSEDKSFNPIRSWSTRAAATTCVLVSISVVCTVTLVVCGVIIVREYSLASAYKKSEDCWVKNITYTELKTCHYCHKDKSKDKHAGLCIPTQFPCVRITVGYVARGRVKEGFLHSDSIEASGSFSQCSFHVCMQNMHDNVQAVEDYVDRWRLFAFRYLQERLDENTIDENVLNQIIANYYNSSSHVSGDKNSSSSNKVNWRSIMENKTAADAGVSSRFFCYYNVDEPHDVIEQKNYTIWDVVHCMLWPSLIIAICCLLFLYIEAHRRNLTCCGVRETEMSGTHIITNHASANIKRGKNVSKKQHYVLNNYSNSAKLSK
ncbi:hypothetical protein HELRODRAFT_194635 [Helobdella robusta]|uniref:Uncharacterized protein n=1 Tax=Helobdella robusta TaxID=6412 RepID=T1FW93_HELRO|nr:hypothetical protein HELRODRAFT_194635 [Helobdella robusta]ESN90847.1 hypothetical protein HELRODRAFT_194635 [Helobdella robusta]